MKKDTLELLLCILGAECLVLVIGIICAVHIHEIEDFIKTFLLRGIR